MNLLKVKSKIYQWTGIFLAYKEENEYIQSKEFWKSFMKMAKHKKNDLNAQTIQGILIGLWQCKHGFYRTWRRGRFWSGFFCIKRSLK